MELRIMIKINITKQNPKTALQEQKDRRRRRLTLRSNKVYVPTRDELKAYGKWISGKFRGGISKKHGRTVQDLYNPKYMLFGMPVHSNVTITPNYFIALKKAEADYASAHPTEYKQYTRLLNKIYKLFYNKRGHRRIDGPSWWRSNNPKSGFSKADINKISWPSYFRPSKEWTVVRGGFFIGGTGDKHKKHGRSLDFTYGTKNSSLPIPLNLQIIMNKHRISSSRKNDKGHQHHINYYPEKIPNSDERLFKAIKKQYHYPELILRKSIEKTIRDIKNQRRKSGSDSSKLDIFKLDPDIKVDPLDFEQALTQQAQTLPDIESDVEPAFQIADIDAIELDNEEYT